jgi:hypothetical protein
VTIWSRTESFVFDHLFRLKGLDRLLLPAGSYGTPDRRRKSSGLSFPFGERPHASAIEMIATSAIELSDARRGDKVASP